MSGPSVFRGKTWKYCCAGDAVTVEVPGTGLAMRAGVVQEESPVSDGDVRTGQSSLSVVCNAVNERWGSGRRRSASSPDI